MKGRKRTFIIYWLLALYIFASLVWWSYLLLNKNKVAFVDQVKFKTLQFNYDNRLPMDARDYLKTPHYNEIKAKYDRQTWMILGEGFVFLALLVMGAIQLWKTFAKEISLARQQHNFMLSITHELKSPLASIKLSLQTFMKRVQMEDKYKKLINNSLEDVDRLDDLVNNILFAARIDNDSFSLFHEKAVISDLVKGAIGKLQLQYPNVNFQVRLDEQIILDVDATAISSAINNLIENAVKYSPESATVEIALKLEEGFVVFEVKDQGIGIPHDEKDNIFKKFYRVGNEETRSFKGTGLGLYIVKRVADRHDGRVIVKDNEPRGTIMQFLLPHGEHI